VTDGALRRVDQLLSELVELVETARAVPMSASCVVPREHVLDLLDDLREVMPPEMTESRRVLSQRDQLLSAAHDTTEQAKSAAEAYLAEARRGADEHAAELVNRAQIHARELVEAGQAEHEQLVSASGVHQSAAEAAARLGTEALQYAETTRAAADEYAAQIQGAADEYAARLRADAEGYADRTLGDLAAVLQRAQATAEQGRQALANRSGGAPVASGPTGPGPDEVDDFGVN
jgi:cell division septum initiation protein DivIVA